MSRRRHYSFIGAPVHLQSVWEAKPPKIPQKTGFYDNQRIRVPQRTKIPQFKIIPREILPPRKLKNMAIYSFCRPEWRKMTLLYKRTQSSITGTYKINIKSNISIPFVSCLFSEAGTGVVALTRLAPPPLPTQKVLPTCKFLTIRAFLSANSEIKRNKRVGSC